MRQFEKDRIFDEYKGDVGNIVTGVVRRREKGTTIVDLGKAEALLPRRESVPGEDYAQGERIRCLLLEIETTPRGPEIILSRASYKFVKKLFELEVSEIAEGSVKIEAMARRARVPHEDCGFEFRFAHRPRWRVRWRGRARASRA